jgi:hypothetical protein
MAVNREMVLLYRQFGRDILDRQQRENWGAEAWPDEAIVQAVLAQITWYHNLAILEKLARMRTVSGTPGQQFITDGAVTCWFSRSNPGG